MRVALDLSSVPRQPAGAGRYMVELARRLPERDIDLTVLVRTDDAERWATVAPRATVSAQVPSSRPARLVYERLRLGRTAAVRGAQVLHSPHYTMPGRPSVPVVVTVHDLTYFTHPEWHERAKVEVFTRAIRHAAQHAAVIIAVSEFTRRELEAHCSLTRPVVVAPHGVDLERFRPSDADPAPEVPYVAFVGTLEPRKGVDVLLDAFGELGSLDPEIELWIAGQVGWKVDDMQRRVDEHPHRARIRQLGYVADDQLPALLRGARVVAYPSRGEGFGLPVLEALACGVPVVTTQDTVMAELAGGAATLVPAGDASSLAAALHRLSALSSGERVAAATKAVERAQLFTWDASISQHLVAYQLATEGVR